MSEITQIPSHLQEMKDRRLHQYKKDSIKNILSLLKVYAPQFDELEQVFFDLRTLRAINAAFGEQLDKIGTIVREDRNGLSDADYRIRLFVRIGTNVSEGEPERIIDVFKLLTGSDRIHYINEGNAGLRLITNTTFADQDEVNLVFQSMQQVVAGGVRINVIICADPTLAFAYAGNNVNAPALGYDDGLGSGGKYATGHRFMPPFAYAGTDPGLEGYGANGDDPLLGGVYSA